MLKVFFMQFNCEAGARVAGTLGFFEQDAWEGLAFFSSRRINNRACLFV